MDIAYEVRHTRILVRLQAVGDDGDVLGVADGADPAPEKDVARARRQRRHVQSGSGRVPRKEAEGARPSRRTTRLRRGQSRHQQQQQDDSQCARNHRPSGMTISPEPPLT